MNDTPAKLKEYAARFKARPGWYFLTGSPENVEAALQKLGQKVDNREAHQNLFLIGNDRTSLWKKALGLAPPEKILPVVESVVDDRGYIYFCGRCCRGSLSSTAAPQCGQLSSSMAKTPLQ